jgi:hypothetical protein
MRIRLCFILWILLEVSSQPWIIREAETRSEVAAVEAHAAMAAMDTVDAGSIVKLEHVNLVIGDLDIAQAFYIQGLGLYADPNVPANTRNNTIWANLGSQQFHLQLQTPEFPFPPQVRHQHFPLCEHVDIRNWDWHARAPHCRRRIHTHYAWLHADNIGLYRVGVSRP